MGRFMSSVVLAIASVGIGAGTARAQETLVAKIPFAFVVRGTELPAGRYDIVNDQGLIVIRGNDAHVGAAAVAMATPAGGHDPEGREPALVFIHSDGRYTLSQIWESDIEGLAVTSRSARGRHESATPAASEPPTVVPAEYAK